jgi:CHASE3 domain sensor protein
MKHWSIGKQLLVGFGSVVVMALMVGGIALWSASALNERVDQLAGVSGQALHQAAEVRFLVADLKARERLVVVATAKQDTAVMALETQTIKEEYGTLKTAIEALNAASQGNPAVTDKSTGIAEAMRAWAEQWAKTEDFAKKLSALDAAESTDAGRRYSDQAADLAKTIQASMTEQFAQDRADAAAIYTWVRGLIGLALLVGVVLAAAVGYAIKNINRTLRQSTAQLRAGSEHVLQAAAQVASSAQTLSRGVL